MLVFVYGSMGCNVEKKDTTLDAFKVEEDREDEDFEEYLMGTFDGVKVYDLDGDPILMDGPDLATIRKAYGEYMLTEGLTQAQADELIVDLDALIDAPFDEMIQLR